MKFKFLIGEAVLLDILGSIVRATVTGKAQFKGKPVYEVTFPNSGNTALKLEEAIESDTLKMIREEEPVKVEAEAA